jgi:hypothetical protein
MGKWGRRQTICPKRNKPIVTVMGIMNQNHIVGVLDPVQRMGGLIAPSMIKKPRNAKSRKKYSKRPLGTSVGAKFQSGIREFRRDKSVDDVFTRYEGGKIDAATACTEIDRLKVPVPESLMMLAKKAPPPEEAEPEWALPDDDELERRFQAGINAADRQETEFVLERAAEVQKLKDEHKSMDSFSPEAVRAPDDTQDYH